MYAITGVKQLAAQIKKKFNAAIALFNYTVKINMRNSYFAFK